MKRRKKRQIQRDFGARRRKYFRQGMNWQDAAAVARDEILLENEGDPDFEEIFAFLAALFQWLLDWFAARRAEGDLRSDQELAELVM